MLTGYAKRAGVMEAVERLLPEIERIATVAASDFTGESDLSEIDADLMIVFGGDGSILRAAHQMGPNQRPVLAVNMGTLGFLADVKPEELLELLETLDLKTLPVVEHLLMQCQVRRGEELLLEKIGLNEVSIQSGPPFTMLHIELAVDGESVTTYHGDGLIISTPVGSTAHSLSAGGPILRKDLQAFTIVPISPHTLSHRPVVDSANRLYDLRVANQSGASLVLDGMVLMQLEAYDVVRVRKSPVPFQLVAMPGHSYYRTLREKLGWSGRLERVARNQSSKRNRPGG
jgi:NAD+ kinase